MLRIPSVALALSTLALAQDGGVDAFEKKIRPVLASRCYACHSSSMASPQAGLRLDSAQGIRQGGNSGAIVQPGEPDRSLLLRAIRYTDKSLKMPPGKPLAPEIVADFEAWVRAGAPMPADQPKADTKAHGTLVPAKTAGCPRYRLYATSAGYGMISIRSS